MQRSRSPGKKNAFFFKVGHFNGMALRIIYDDFLDGDVKEASDSFNC